MIVGKLKQIQNLFSVLALMFLPINALAVTPGKILTEDEAGEADTVILQAESNMFNSIGMSIALSLALCEGQEECVPSVNEGELNELVGTLDKRINGMIQRQEESGEDLNELITAYVDVRENYLRYLEKLGTFDIPEPEELTIEDMVAEDSFETVEEDFSMFEDIDEELFEEEELVDDELFEE